MEASEVISVVTEVIGWIALAGALVCLLLALLIRLADGRWLRTDAVVLDQEHGSTVRWFAEGAFHQRRLSDEERVHVRNLEEEPAYYREPDEQGQQEAHERARKGDPPDHLGDDRDDLRCFHAITVSDGERAARPRRRHAPSAA